jgi:pimeloyl-ACP methyl ester carboxylesterase
LTMSRPAPDDPKIARLYRDVPPEQVEVLRRFRADHPLKQAEIGGRAWEYIAAGRGDRALLLLPGSLGTADSTWIVLPHFEDRFRVIAPTYAEVLTMAELVDGIAGILDREGIEKAAVSGGSYGGVMAQVFVRRHPGRTERLILSHTFLPEPGSRIRQMERALRLFRYVPEGLLRTLFRKRMAGLLPKTPETALFRAYVQEVAELHVTKKSLLALYGRIVDLYANYHFKPADLEGWPGKILLLMSDNDPVTPTAARVAQQALYPRAEAHVFSGSGHATALLQPQRYFEVMDRFLE